MKSEMNMKQTVTTPGKRGTTLVTSTSPDKSEIGDKGVGCLKNPGFKGGVNDMSHSLNRGSK